MFLAASLALLSWSKQAATVDIAPTILTYRELAGALSTPDRKIVCAPSIAERAAVVAFHGRDAGSVEDAITHGLGVVFLTQANGSLSMDEAPTVTASERGLVSSWVGRVDSASATVLRRAHELLPDWSRGSLRENQTKLMEYTVASRESADPVSASAAAMLSSFIVEPGGTALGWVFEGAGGLRSLMRRDIAIYGTSSSGNRLGLPTWVGTPWRSPSDPCTVDRAFFDPVAGVIVTTHCSSEGPARPELAPPQWSVGDFPWLASSLRPQVGGDWDKAVAQLPPKLMTALDSAELGRDDCVSTARAVLGWARLTNSDVVMEVSPVRDAVPPTVDLSSPVKLPDVLWARGLGKRNLLALLHPRYDPNAPADRFEIEHATGLISLHPWTLSSRSGVLVVKNRFAYIDHCFPVPFGTLLPLIRGGNQGSETERVDLGSLLAYCATTKKEDDIAVARTRPAIVPRTLGVFYPFGRFAAGAFKWKLSEFQRSLKEGPIDVQLAKVSGSLRDEFSRNLSALAVEVGERLHDQPRDDFDAMVLHPDFGSRLREMTLRFEYTSNGSTDGDLCASLSLPAKDVEMPLLVSVVIPHVSLGHG